MEIQISQPSFRIDPKSQYGSFIQIKLIGEDATGGGKMSLTPRKLAVEHYTIEFLSGDVGLISEFIRALDFQMSKNKDVFETSYVDTALKVSVTYKYMTQFVDWVRENSHNQYIGIEFVQCLEATSADW
jgi:hypothetical protein